MILEVNGVSFERLSNDDAVRTLREAVQHPGYHLTHTSTSAQVLLGSLVVNAPAVHTVSEQLQAQSWVQSESDWITSAVDCLEDEKEDYQNCSVYNSCAQ